MSARLVFPLVLAAAMFAVSPASGADDDVPFDYGKLVQQLDADAFGDRQRASEQLSAAGKRALPDLKKAALGDSREASTRALHILRNHFRTGSDDLKAAAKSALQELAQS
ncbi:MAG: hypothetical protein QF805_18880, partial [Pirellulaceae bacterium]|nr:hypothetical protein [Pirellulaceae bacterium]